MQCHAIVPGTTKTKYKHASYLIPDTRYQGTNQCRKGETETKDRNKGNKGNQKKKKKRGKGGIIDSRKRKNEATKQRNV